MSKSFIIIPSRLSATRLPNKPLININGKPLIMHVYEKAKKSQIGKVYVATCDNEIAIEVKKPLCLQYLYSSSGFTGLLMTAINRCFLRLSILFCSEALKADL